MRSHKIYSKRVSESFLKHVTFSPLTYVYNMTIDLYTLCFNEIDILPFIVDYWKRLPLNKVVVFDNFSTDGSITYLKQFPFVEVRYFKTEGMNDIVQANIKNLAWRESKGKADYVIVCDMDEVLYSKDLNKTLLKMKEGGYNVLGTPWYACCFDKRPSYTEGKLLHELGDKFYRQSVNRTHPHLGKFMLFDPNLIDNMQYSVGCHIAHPLPQMKLLETNDVVAIHVNKGLSEDYFVERRKVMCKNLSETNNRYGLCFEYHRDEETTRNEYRENQSKAVNINEYV